MREETMQTNTALKMEDAPKMGLKSVLRTAQKPVTESKSKTPTLPVNDEIKQLAQEVKDAKNEADSAMTIFDMKSAELIAKMSPMRQDLCRKEYLSAVRVPTMDNLSVTIVWSGNYIKIKPESEPMLINVVGEKYTDYFKSKFVIQAADKSDEELYKLFEWLGGDAEDEENRIAIGQERFAQFFQVDEVIRPTERFVREHILMDNATREELAAAGVRQYKPAVKSR
jgi:hypothetical protein